MFLHILSLHFLLFPIKKKKKNVFIISVSFFDKVSNFNNRLLSNQKPGYVIRNCQWNCICNSAVIKII